MKINDEKMRGKKVLEAKLIFQNIKSSCANLP